MDGGGRPAYSYLQSGLVHGFTLWAGGGRLFSEISRLIFVIIQHFYNKAANRPIKTGMVLAYQTSGEFFRAGHPRGIHTGTPSCWKAALMRMAGSCISLSGT